MNKSKFLKKSLAMLLAVMLVVAMIPLSAAAATTKPVISAVTVGKDDVNATISGTEISVEISASAYSAAVTATKLPVKILTGSSSDTAVYGKNSQSVTLNSNLGEMLLNEGTKEGNVITFPITVSNADADEDAEYTLTVTVKAASDDTDIESFKVYGQISSSVDNDAKTISVVMPYASSVSSLTVGDTLTSDGQAVVKSKDGADVTPTSISLSNGKATVYSTAESGRKVSYQLTVTTAKGFATEKNSDEEDVLQFTIPGQLEETIVTGTAGTNAAQANQPTALIAAGAGDYGIINVSMPYGTGTDDNGDDLDELKLIPKFTTDLSGAKVTVKDATDAKNNATLTSGKTAVNLINAIGASSSVTVEVSHTYANLTKTVAYKLCLIPSEDNPSADITEFTVGAEGGTVEGKTLNVKVGVNQSLTNATVGFTHSKDAAVSIPLQGKTTDVKDASSTDTKTVYTGVNVTNDVVVRVVSKDGETTNDYTLKVEKATDAVDPKITSLILKDEDDTEYKANLTGTTFTFTLPYGANPTAGKNMDGWKLYYARTYGTKLSYGSAPYTELPSSGSTLAGTIGGVSYSLFGDVIPNYVADDKSVGKIRVAALDADGNEATTFAYTVKVVRSAALTNKTLNSVEFSTVNATEDMTAENAVKGAVTTNSAKEKVVTFTFPHKTYVNATGKDLYPQYAADKGAVAYVVDETAGTVEKVVTVDNHEADDTTYPNVTAIDFDNAVAGKVDIFVLDETADFEWGLTATQNVAAMQALATAADTKGHVTKYNVELKKADARKGNTLSSFSLGEYAVASISTGKLSITVPKSYADGSADYLQLVPEFKVSPGASIYAGVTGDTTPVAPELISGGVKDEDGNQVTLGTDANPAIKITGVPGGAATVTLDADAADKTITHLYVFDEGTTTYTPYELDVTIANAEQGAELTAFSINNHSAKIAGKDVSVTVPHNTDLTNLVASFTVSKMAKVEIDSTKLVSGETAYDYSNTVKLVVTSEDEYTKNVYNVTVTQDPEYSDVKPTDWFYNAVTKATELAIVSGMGDGTFAPNKNISRGDFAIMVVNMLGQDAVNEANKIETSPFTDVDIKNDYYAKAIAYCESKGYISGMGDGTFAPKANITRQQMAVILANVLELDPITNPTEKFADDASIASWAKGAVYACKKAGIISGMDAKNFVPTANATRAQAATIFVNAHGMLK